MNFNTLFFQNDLTIYVNDNFKGYVSFQRKNTHKCIVLKQLQGDLQSLYFFHKNICLLELKVEKDDIKTIIIKWLKGNNKLSTIVQSYDNEIDLQHIHYYENENIDKYSSLFWEKLFFSFKEDNEDLRKWNLPTNNFWEETIRVFSVDKTCSKLFPHFNSFGLTLSNTPFNDLHSNNVLLLPHITLAINKGFRFYRYTPNKEIIYYEGKYNTPEELVNKYLKYIPQNFEITCCLSCPKDVFIFKNK